jgi:alginate O-acetyltransferase complex protein AlgI
MLFTSSNFIFIFLPIFCLFLILFKNIKILNRFIIELLIVFSLFFYAIWNVNYLFLFIGSIIINFYFSKKIIENKNVLFYGIVFNIFVLIYFKYLFFFLNIFNLNTNFYSSNKILIPLGISFYTLQQIAFLCDCYERKIKNINFYKYTLFVSFFPQLIAGPIVRYENVKNYLKIKNLIYFNYSNIQRGVFLICFGLFEKIIIADTISIYVDRGYLNLQNLSYIEMLLITWGFYFQILFDFSGYCTVAIGLAILINIKLPENFNRPYRSKSMIDFWRNWHITLSNFINEYIFFKLATLIGSSKTYLIFINILLTMTLIGLWHGAGWNFIIFGFVNGFFIVVNHFYRQFIPRFINQFFSLILTIFCWYFALIFFRSADILESIFILKKILFLDSFIYQNNFNNLMNLENIIFNLKDILLFSSSIFFAIIVSFGKFDLRKYIENLNINKKNIFLIFIFLIIIYLFPSNNTNFIYFQF